MYSQTSFIKRTGQGARRQFQIMHLAVFPYQAELLKNNEFETIAYFEKGNQIIGVNGEHPITIPPAPKGEKLRLSCLAHIIKFHLYSQSNVVYKWSLYKRHANGSQEYLESCAFNLKEIVANYILPLRNETQNTINSSIANDFHEKELRGKFVKTGLILNFALMLSNDPNSIENYVGRTYCDGTSTFKRSHNQPIEISNGSLLRGPETSSEISFQSASMLSEPPLLKNESKKDGEKPKFEHLLSEEKEIESSVHYELPEDEVAMDLDDLILNEQKRSSENLVEKTVNERDDDLNFGVEKNLPQTSPEINAQAEYTDPEPANRKPDTSNKPRARDYSLLKLESDQGGLRREQIDDALERQQLGMIEEQKLSARETVKHSSSSFKAIPSRQRSLKPPRGMQLGQISRQLSKSSMVSQSLNFKKIILVFIVIAIAFMVAAAYNYNFKKTKYKSKAKAK